MTKRVAVVMLVGLLALAVAADAGQGTGRISGVARDAQSQVLANVKVQLRNVDTGQLVATSRAGADGRFEFSGLAPANYVVEIVNDDGKIVGLSPSTALAAGGVITGLSVAATAAGALAGAAAAGGVGSFFASTGGILLLAGIGVAGTAAVISITQDASASK